MALIESFQKSAPSVRLDNSGYMAEPSQNLLAGISLDDFAEDLQQGDGNELENKFLAAHSSSALAVNVFAPFKSHPGALWFPEGRGFTSIHFERKCPHGLAGRRSPNLDLLADGPGRIVAVESKCLEYLVPHRARFAPAYELEIRDRRRQSAWFAEMLQLIKDPQRYRWLDAAQLVKHALGISHSFVDRPSMLLYLFWEPLNVDAHPIFAEHRAEVAKFGLEIRGGSPEFLAMSYAELWDQWDLLREPAWLTTHLARVRARYAVAV